MLVVLVKVVDGTMAPLQNETSVGLFTSGVGFTVSVVLVFALVPHSLVALTEIDFVPALLKTIAPGFEIFAVAGVPS